MQKIPFREHISTILTGLIIAAVMGYFYDLRNGDVGGFVFVLIFTPTASWAVNVLRLRRKMRKPNPPEEGG